MRSRGLQRSRQRLWGRVIQVLVLVLVLGECTALRVQLKSCC